MLSNSQRPKLVLIGSAGDVGQKRYRPAFAALLAEGKIADCLYVDCKAAAEAVNDGEHDRYVQTEGVSRIVPELAKRGFIGPNVHVLVATPTWLHTEYAQELHDHVACIGIEKPIAWNAREAEILAQLPRVYPIEHQVYKHDSIAMCRHSAARKIRWSTVRHARFCLHETGGVGDREIDNIILDTGYHGFAVLLAAISKCHANIRINPGISWISTYRDGADRPRECTAAFLSGVITADDNVQMTYTITVGKGLAASQKGLTLFRDSGKLLTLDLNESGYEPHKRVIESMLMEQEPLLSVGDSITIVAACEEARTQARGEVPYTFGSTPNWLTPAPRRVA